MAAFKDRVEAIAAGIMAQHYKLSLQPELLARQVTEAAILLVREIDAQCKKKPNNVSKGRHQKTE